MKITTRITRPNVRVRIRRRIVRIEIEQTRIGLIVPIPTDIEHLPTGIRVHITARLLERKQLLSCQTNTEASATRANNPGQR